MAGDVSPVAMFFIGLWNLILLPTVTGVALCFLLTRHPLVVKDSWHPWFSQTPGSFWATRLQFSRCSLGSLGGLQCLSWLIFFSNRVAPASVDSSVHLRLWGKLFIGVTPPNREAECLVRKGVGLWTIFWAESNPVPDSLSHPIPWPWKMLPFYLLIWKIRTSGGNIFFGLLFYFRRFPHCNPNVKVKVWCNRSNIEIYASNLFWDFLL